MENLIQKIKMYFEKKPKNEDSEAYKSAKQRAEFFEKIMGHIGMPKGVIHNLDVLKDYCDSNSLPFAQTSEGDDYVVSARLGKANYQITYDNKGNYKGMHAEFVVKTNGQRLPI